MNIFSSFTCIFWQNWLKIGSYVPGYLLWKKKLVASLVEGNVPIENIKQKKTNHIWKIADALFEGDLCENISDVSPTAPIIHAWKQSSVSEYFF